LEAFLGDWWVDHQGWPYPDEARGSVTRILAAVEHGMTPEQRRHLGERLGDLADDLEALIPADVRVPARAGEVCGLLASAIR
jgi:hypothetical protein